MSDNPPFPSPTKLWHNKAQPITLPTRPELSAKGKNVVITGGGNTGIGGETARYYAAAGARRIALLGRREKPLQENKAYIEEHYPNVEVVTISTDITKQNEVETAFFKFLGPDGKLDVLIHAATIIGPKATVAEADGPEFLEAINTNLAGAFYVAQAFVKHAAPDAVAVAMNTWGAYLSLNDAYPSYSIAKLAIFRLWDTVAIANPDLAIFHTQPGVVLTETNLRVGGAKSFKDVPIDDVSLPAAFNLWLGSPEAKFLKGKFVWCNWDVEELMAKRSEIESTQQLNISLVGWPFGEEVKKY